MANQSEALLRYRPWKGDLHPPIFASLAMARTLLGLILRRKLFWALYALALMIFFFFFYGQYLVIWIQQQVASQTVVLLGFRLTAEELSKFLSKLNLNGSPHTFGNFIWFEGYITMIVLALAGSVLVGNDFHYRSLPYYLSKPMGTGHYLLGKIFAAGGLIQLLTTIPALVLFIQAGLLYDWQSFYLDNFTLMLGIVAYGLLITLTLGLLLVATAIWVRQTVPLVMIWSGVFVLCHNLANMLVDRRALGEYWRLIDLWNDLYLVGLWLLGADRTVAFLGPQPPVWAAGLVVAAVCAGCLLVLRRQFRSVEVIA